MTFFTFLLVSVTGISLMRNWNWIFSQSSSLGKSMLSPMEMIRTPASRRSSSSTSPRLFRREKREKSFTTRMSYWWDMSPFRMAW